MASCIEKGASVDPPLLMLLALSPPTRPRADSARPCVELLLPVGVWQMPPIGPIPPLSVLGITVCVRRGSPLILLLVVPIVMASWGYQARAEKSAVLVATETLLSFFV